MATLGNFLGKPARPKPQHLPSVLPPLHNSLRCIEFEE
jgi:hypothetical protein